MQRKFFIGSSKEEAIEATAVVLSLMVENAELKSQLALSKAEQEAMSVLLAQEKNARSTAEDIVAKAKLLSSEAQYNAHGLSKEHLRDVIRRILDPEHNAQFGVWSARRGCSCTSCADFKVKKFDQAFKKLDSLLDKRTGALPKHNSRETRGVSQEELRRLQSKWNRKL